MSANRAPAPPKIEPPKAPDPVREELYALRNRILAKASRLPIEDLRRLVELLDSLSDGDARKIARFAEALAEWPDPDASSG